MAMKNTLPNILAIFKPNFIPSSRPTSYHVLHMIFPKFMILRTTWPQSDSLTFASLISLANYKAFAWLFPKSWLSPWHLPWLWHRHHHDTAMTMFLTANMAWSWPSHGTPLAIPIKSIMAMIVHDNCQGHGNPLIHHPIIPNPFLRTVTLNAVSYTHLTLPTKA